MKLFVTLNGRTRAVELDGDRVVVDGVAWNATLAAVSGTPLHQVTVGDRPLILAAHHAGAGAWVLQDRGEVVEIEALDERTRHIRSMVAEGKRQAGPAQIKAPMPGLVVRLLVAEGAEVDAGAGVVILEAMKMENELKAAGPGVVSRVLVREGAAVEKGQVLVEFAAPPT